MPVCRRIAESGFAAKMRSTDPPVTMPAWASMTTGKDPGHLGCYGIRTRRDFGYESLSTATASDIREPRIWDVLGAAGIRSILLGIPQTYPPGPVNGICISGIPAPDTTSPFAWPVFLQNEIRSAYPDYRIDIQNFRSLSPSSLADQITCMTRTRFDLFRRLLRDHDWRFAMMVEIALDRLHHGFWHFWDPDHPLYPGPNEFSNIIPDYYALLDREIGSTIAELPSNTGVLIVSDHGARAMRGGVRINHWLMKNGWLTLKHHQTREVPLQPDIIDWKKTKAWGEGGYFGRIFLNVAGRERFGIIRKAEYQSVRNRLAASLEIMTGPDQQPLHNQVIYPDRHFPVVNGIPPDLMVYFGDLAWRSLGGVGPSPEACGDGVFTLKNDRGPDGANHDFWGICIGNISNTRESAAFESSKSRNPCAPGTRLAYPAGDFTGPGNCRITDVPDMVYEFFNLHVDNRNLITS